MDAQPVCIPIRNHAAAQPSRPAGVSAAAAMAARLPRITRLLALAVRFEGLLQDGNGTGLCGAGTSGRCGRGTPEAPLIRDSAGNLYGTTYAGGAFNFGTVFKLDKTGNETVLHSFTGGTDGAYPQEALILSDSNLYGTTNLRRFHSCCRMLRSSVQARTPFNQSCGAVADEVCQTKDLEVPQFKRFLIHSPPSSFLRLLASPLRRLIRSAALPGLSVPKNSLVA